MNPNGKALLKENKRYYLLDSLRGISIISMIAFHLCYDLFMIYGINTSWYFYPITAVWERSICVVFILVSGMCLNFTRNGIKRGILLNLAGFAVTCVTVIAEPNQAVWFGVLNLIGCSMMIVSVLSVNLKKIRPLSGALISFLLYAVSYDVPKGYVGLFGLDIVKLPDFLYSCKYLAFLGFPSSDFFSTDFFPLFPWIFLFAAGFYLWNFIVEKNLTKYFELKIPVLDKIGRYSLWIYLAHQPIIMGILMLAMQPR
ncbi:heparan-alpha-glucosaminide N-acetyltransferase [Ruminococcus bromii]|uniref:heparan-alpha-glucosaminide N-acetyltransferase n=1 Tax=Ruminococcus bromii TaxID=40518 RepID=UPI00241C8C2A|nr:heparan-alpha-glucosaminide N-acetyltransferase [Ruminococcus bromii]